MSEDEDKYPSPEQFKRFKEWSKLTEEIVKESPFSAISLIISIGIIDDYVNPREDSNGG